jgi:hypothetical protein
MRRAAQARVPVPAVRAADAAGIRRDRVDGYTSGPCRCSSVGQASRVGRSRWLYGMAAAGTSGG